jgi:competence protein ComEA
MNKHLLVASLLVASLSVNAFAGTQQSAPLKVASASQKLNINTASLKQLDNLPRVGKVIATRILQYRKAHKGFNSVEELSKVKGLSPKRVQSIASLVSVG